MILIGYISFPSLLRRQEPSLKRSFSCRAGNRHQNGNNQLFDLIETLLFSEICKTSKALLCTGHPPARVRQISGFAKVSALLMFYGKPYTHPKKVNTYFFGWVLIAQHIHAFGRRKLKHAAR